MNTLDFDAIFRVGVQGVDDQHLAIAKMIDALSVLDATEASSESISDAMAAIGKLMREHFDAEEEVLVQLGAPADEVEAHKSDHTRLLDEYVGLIEDALDGRPPVPSELAAFLQGWLSDHIVNHDLKIRDYLPRGMTALGKH